MSWLTPLLCALAPAQAGELAIETRVPVEVHVDQLPVARLYGPGTAIVPLPAGEHTLAVYRGGVPERLVARADEAGTVRLLVGPSTLSLLDAPAEATEATAIEAAPPSLQLRAPAGPGAIVLLGGERLTLVPGEPLTITGLEAGSTALEIRSVDGSVIWARGELELVDGDDLVLVVPEGRPLEVFGRASAWVPGS